MEKYLLHRQLDLRRGGHHLKIPLTDENIMSNWDSKKDRENVIRELEEIFRTHGNPLRKGSSEIESQLFEKARNENEYHALAQRLLRHLKDLANLKLSTEKRQIHSEHQLSGVPATSAHTVLHPTSGWRDSAPAVFSSKEVFHADSTAEPTAGNQSGTQLTSTATTAEDLVFDTVRLPAPNKRTFLTPVNARFLARRPGSLTLRDEQPELLTQLLHGEPSSTGNNEELSAETFEASFKFLVPRNSVIKQITVLLKQMRRE